MRKELRVAATVATLLCLSSFAHAQDFNQVAPKQPTPQQPGVVTSPAPVKVTPPPEIKTLIPSLKGLRLVPAIGWIERNGAHDTGVTAQYLPLLQKPEIQAQLSAFLGKPLTTADLPRISKAIIDWYRAHNRPVVDVAFPEQDISTGVLQAVVAEYRVGQVRVEGNQWFSSGILTDEMSLEHGDVLDFDVLRSDLNWLNRNPFRQVNVVLERSQEVGATDVVLKAQDQLPLRVYASYDNEGQRITGRERYSAGFNWGDVFGLDQQISYQFSTSPDLWRSTHRGPGLSDNPRYTAHSFTYFAPLPWGDGIDVFGAYVQQVPDLGPFFGQVGHSFQVSGRYDVRLPATESIAQQIRVGFDFKRTDNNLAFGGIRIFAAATVIDQFLLIYDGTRPDDWGQTALENTFVYSPGHFGPSNSTAVFQASGVNGADAQYVYDNLQITRVTDLPWEMSWLVRGTAQIAGSELLPSEQLGAGGVDSVRGYDPRVVNGSQGVLFSSELRSPPVHPLRDFTDLGVEDQGQALIFWDYGDVSYKNDQMNLPKSATLASVGVGARYSIADYLDARFDYGWQLRKLPGATKHGNLATISVTLSY
ncbi:MAG TPA: ShlB/FhaC/HecB family hemolysin secretion/activation protein [Rhizomicrobium sp.]